MKLSAIVITKNEAPVISACLHYLSFADQCVVVDAESSDRTAEIARANGATVFVRPWPGYGEQKDFGANQALHDWVLFVDADEQVTEELANEIKTKIASGEKQFYWLKIVTVFLGRPLFHLYGHNPRLFNKQVGAWTQTLVHEQVLVKDTKNIIKLGDDLSAVLENPLLHHSHPTIESYLKKMDHYTTLDAKEMQLTQKHRSGRSVRAVFWLPYHLSIRQFVKMYLYKKGFLDGYAGFMWCVLSAYYEYVMSKKFLSLERKSI